MKSFTTVQAGWRAGRSSPERPPPPRHTRLDSSNALYQDIGALVVPAVVSFVKRHPVKIGLNFVGLALLFLFHGFEPSEQVCVCLTKNRLDCGEKDGLCVAWR